MKYLCVLFSFIILFCGVLLTTLATRHSFLDTFWGDVFGFLSLFGGVIIFAVGFLGIIVWLFIAFD